MDRGVCYLALSLQFQNQLLELTPHMPLYITHKSVHISLAGHFVDNILVIIVTESSA